MKDYTYTKMLSEEKIKRVAKSGNYDELSDDELQRLVNIQTLKQIKTNNRFISFIMILILLFLFLSIFSSLINAGII